MCQSDTLNTVVGVTKFRNIVPRAGIGSISLAFWASVLPLHHIGFHDVITIPMPTFLCSPLPQRAMQATTKIEIIKKTDLA